MTLVVGVDGGNSGTRALLLDSSGKVHGYGEGGNANHQGQGIAAALDNIRAAVIAACSQAGAQEPPAFIHFAIAGDDTPDDHRALTEALQSRFDGSAFSVSNDVWAGLRAGSPDGIGVAVNCGTGCGVVARSARGAMEMIADVGYIYGDSGGGMQIAVDAVRAVIRAWDGRGPETALSQAVLEHLGRRSAGDLYMDLYRGDLKVRALRTLTAIVIETAASDAVARGILQRIGGELGLGAAALAKRLGMLDEQFRFVLTGGTFRTLSSPLAEAAIERLRAVAPRCVPGLPRITPVAGAALQALDGSGTEVTEEHYRALVSQGFGRNAE